MSVDKEMELLGAALNRMLRIVELMESSDVPHEAIATIFSQMYAFIGKRYDLEPKQMIQNLVFHAIAIDIFQQNPNLSTEELNEAVCSELDFDNPTFNRSKPDPDMPLFLMPTVGEA
jgi:hypothetical protein